MTAYLLADNTLLDKSNPNRWLVTGAAGFIGSHIVETLLKCNQQVVGLDNFSTGHQRNLAEIKEGVELDQWKNFDFVEGDVRELATCQTACKDMDYVLHQAALASVPDSIKNPVEYNQTNVTGFVNILTAAKARKVKRFVYASSSAVYGNGEELPKREDKTIDPISPYAASKFINEIYAKTFSHCYGLETVGLRYFNVFGSRQDPNGPYAAVIPKWITGMLEGENPIVYGGGRQTRDFIFVKDVARININAALSKKIGRKSFVCNVGSAKQTDLISLFDDILSSFSELGLQCHVKKILDHKPKREGDVDHSYADVMLLKSKLDCFPITDMNSAIKSTIVWYRKILEEALIAQGYD